MKSFHRRLHAHIEIKLVLELTSGRMRDRECTMRSPKKMQLDCDFVELMMRCESKCYEKIPFIFF